MRIIGQFRDLDDPNRFVWLRGFEDMSSRRDGLAAFYGGPEWRAHRDAANATMVDSDNVLLLKPARPASGFVLDGLRRAKVATDESPSGTVVAAIASLSEPPTSEYVDRFERAFMPALTRDGASVLAYFVTEGSANNFPALPVREGENVFVWIARLPAGTIALSKRRDARTWIAHTSIALGRHDALALGLTALLPRAEVPCSRTLSDLKRVREKLNSYRRRRCSGVLLVGRSYLTY